MIPVDRQGEFCVSDPCGICQAARIQSLAVLSIALWSRILTGGQML
ncbi:hypothetical protein LBWT_X1780 (plasmid) [Leptolyngbya boryana IAM M-101]|nr:hypothetical protein LBWT_X1780 [Leptolyngbya boryana IAM M-101]BAS66454.1 hypothetical protein LBDG_X1780 [Leptolyngbya boryana dg5]